MKEQLGFITVGQGGGNIGLLLEQKGYKVLHINTSPEDLATLKEAKHVYHIKGGEGCKKDRNKAKVLIEKDFETISENIKQVIPHEYVIVVFTTGGGTGSGSSPMLIELLIEHLGKKVGVVCVLPSRKEQLRTFINAYECFVELEGIDGLGATFILDNEKAEADKFSINDSFVELLDSLLKVPEYHNAKGNIDVAEMKELLSTRGAAVISKLTKNADDAKALIKSFRENIFAPVEGDRIIKYIGLSALSSIDVSEVTVETGTCLEVFQGVNPINTVCVFCGLTYPYTELKKLKERVEENKEVIVKMASTKAIRLDDGIDLADDLEEKQFVKSKKNVTDVFAKYRKK